MCSLFTQLFPDQTKPKQSMIPGDWIIYPYIRAATLI